MTEPEKNTGSASPTVQELQSAKNVISLFLTALKNSALYPEDHAISKKFLKNVHTGLYQHLNNFGTLRLDVAKDGLFSQGETIHQESLGDERFAFLLFVDGITWLEFHEGIELEEISSFFRILNKYKESQEEAEGDVVTALWDLNLPHLRYEAIDVLWEADSLLDLSLINRDFKYSGAAEDDLRDQQTPVEGQEKEGDGSDLFILSDNEKQNLQDMVLAEEQNESADDVLDILLIILQGQSGKEDFETVLSFLQVEFRKTLAQGELSFAISLLENMRVILMTCQTDKPWAVSMLEEFFKKISSQDSLAGLYTFLPSLSAKDHDTLEQLANLLSLLAPEAIESLAAMIEEFQAPLIQQILMDAMKKLAEQDSRPLETILNDADESLIVKLLPIFGVLQSERATIVLGKYLRHSATALRRAALVAFFQGKGRDINEISPLIQDPSSVIRELALNFLGRERAENYEKLLLKFLRRGNYQKTDSKHLMACYKTLGRCGSFESISFLKQVLFNRGWRSFFGFGKVVQRRGAAEALRLLDLDESAAILEKAALSHFPAIRKAAEKRG